MCTKDRFRIRKRARLLGTTGGGFDQRPGLRQLGMPTLGHFQRLVEGQQLDLVGGAANVRRAAKDAEQNQENDNLHRRIPYRFTPNRFKTTTITP